MYGLPSKPLDAERSRCVQSTQSPWISDGNFGGPCAFADTAYHSLFVRVVVQVWAEPALDLGHGHAFALVIVGDLVAVDLAEREVARFGVGEVEAAYAGAGPHGEGLGDQHSGVRLDVEQTPDRALLGVVGAGGVAGGGADAAIFFVDELLGAQVFGAGRSPTRRARACAGIRRRLRRGDRRWPRP